MPSAKTKAIGLARISSAGQEEGHSLDAQEKSIRLFADELDVELVNLWKTTVSSKAGNNEQRKDLDEILKYCKKHPDVKLLIIDRVNRYMRDADYMVYFAVILKQHGVKIMYADPQQRYLNDDTGLAKLMRYIKGYEAEQENAERRQTTIVRMQRRIEEGYYISHPHLGYRKTDIPGHHEPSEPAFTALQKASYRILDGMTIKDSVRLMNSGGIINKSGRPMDITKFKTTMSSRYYCGIIDISTDGWPENIKGVHTAMLTEQQHQKLMLVIKGHEPRKRKQFNPAFPLAKLLKHYECKDSGRYDKFTGLLHNRGKRNGIPRPLRPVYDCRGCRKRHGRSDVHSVFQRQLSKLSLVTDNALFIKALEKTWEKHNGSQKMLILGLEKKIKAQESLIESTTASYVEELDPTVKLSIKSILQTRNNQLDKLKNDLAYLQANEPASAEFISFALAFMTALPYVWFDLEPEDQKRGEEILFNGELYIDNELKLHTPKLSAIYTLGPSKKDLGEVSLSRMVELVGTAPTSVSLSLLVVYRLSLF